MGALYYNKGGDAGISLSIKIFFFFTSWRGVVMWLGRMVHLSSPSLVRMEESFSRLRLTYRGHKSFRNEAGGTQKMKRSTCRLRNENARRFQV